MSGVSTRALSEDDCGEEAGPVSGWGVQRGGGAQGPQVSVRAPQSPGREGLSSVPCPPVPPHTQTTICRSLPTTPTFMETPEVSCVSPSKHMLLYVQWVCHQPQHLPHVCVCFELSIFVWCGPHLLVMVSNSLYHTVCPFFHMS